MPLYVRLYYAPSINHIASVSVEDESQLRSGYVLHIIQALPGSFCGDKVRRLRVEVAEIVRITDKF